MSKKYKIETIKTDKLNSHNVTIENDFSVFRYRAVNDYTINALLKDELWATRPDFFNDPYDSSFTVDVKKLRDKLLDLFEGDFILYYGKSNKIKPLTKKYIATKWIEDMYYQNMNNLKKMYLIACFSESVDNEAMWAHYSNNGTGFAIEYYYEDLLSLKSSYINYVKEITSNFLNSNQAYMDLFPNINDTDYSVYNIYPVIYDNTKFNGTEILSDVIGVLPRLFENKEELTYIDILKFYTDSGINLYDTKRQKTFIDSTYFLKKKLWKYEKEWRMLIPNLLIDVTKVNQAHHFIGQIKPKSVYLGEYATIATKTIIYNYCYTHSVPLFQMKSQVGNLKYNLQPVEIDNQAMLNFLNGKY
jgi:hypothetical protein